MGKDQKICDQCKELIIANIHLSYTKIADMILEETGKIVGEVNIRKWCKDHGIEKPGATTGKSGQRLCTERPVKRKKSVLNLVNPYTVKVDWMADDHNVGKAKEADRRSRNYRGERS